MAEIGAALKKGGKKTLSDEDLESLVKTIDTNKDGEVDLAEFEAIFELAPNAIPYGGQQLVDVSGTLFGAVGKAADIAYMPVGMLTSALMPKGTTSFKSDYVYDTPTEYILKEKFFSFGATNVMDGKGENILTVPYKVMSIKEKMRICDMAGTELLLLEQIFLSMSPTFYVKSPSGDVLLTMRSKMLTLENYIYVYEGQATFDFGNNTTAKKLFTLKGFSIFKGLNKKTGLFGASVEDNATGKVCAKVKETVVAIQDTYTLVVEPGYDCLLFVGMMLCVDKMNEARG